MAKSPDSRVGLLQRILETKFELDSADPEEKPAFQARLNQLLNEALQGKLQSKQDLLAAINERYRPYRARRLKGEQVSVASAVLGTAPPQTPSETTAEPTKLPPDPPPS
jgi:hypothetical protein